MEGHAPVEGVRTPPLHHAPGTTGGTGTIGGAGTEFAVDWPGTGADDAQVDADLARFAAQCAAWKVSPTSRAYARFAAEHGAADLADVVRRHWNWADAVPHVAVRPPRPTGARPSWCDAQHRARPTLAEARQSVWELRWGPTVAAAAAAGRPANEIAARIGEPDTRVRALVARLGLTDRPGRRRDPGREAEMVAMWASGMALAEVGAHFGVTHEWVRQVVERSGATRTATPAQRRRERFAEAHGERIRALAQRCGSIEALCEALGGDVPRQAVARYLADEGIRCTGNIRTTQRWTATEILDGLRAASEELGVVTAAAWARWAPGRGLPVPLTVMKRFGTWTEALRRAGVPRHRAHRTGAPLRWSPQQCVEAVRRWLTTTDEPTVTRYEADRARVALPSVGTLRRLVGPWAQVLRCARLWQEILDSGAMTLAEADLGPQAPPHPAGDPGDPGDGVVRPPPDRTAVTAALAAFVDDCRLGGVYPSMSRYQRWARSHDGAPSPSRAYEAFGRSWAAALASAGYDTVAPSPNPAARRGP